MKMTDWQKEINNWSKEQKKMLLKALEVLESIPIMKEEFKESGLFLLRPLTEMTLAEVQIGKGSGAIPSVTP